MNTEHMNIDQFGEIFETHRREIYKVCLNRCRRLEIPTYHVKEIVQDTFLRGWEYINTLKDKDNLLPWLVTIAVNKVNNLGRRKSRLTIFEQDILEMADKVGNLSYGPIQENPVRYEQLFKDVGRKLTEEQFAALLLRADGKGMYEQAEILGVSPAAVSGRVQRAREQYRLGYTKSYPKRCDVMNPGASSGIIEQYRAEL